MLGVRGYPGMRVAYPGPDTGESREGRTGARRPQADVLLTLGLAPACSGWLRAVAVNKVPGALVARQPARVLE